MTDNILVKEVSQVRIQVIEGKESNSSFEARS